MSTLEVRRWQAATRRYRCNHCGVHELAVDRIEGLVCVNCGHGDMLRISTRAPLTVGQKAAVGAGSR